MQAKDLAFGCLLGGYKGFVTRAWYPVLYAACHPQGTVDEVYANGLMSKLAYDVFAVFQPGDVLTATDIRLRLDMETKTEAAKVDKALAFLQQQFWLSPCGCEQRLSKTGQPYGWPMVTYCHTQEWAGDWLGETIAPQDARARILAHCAGWQREIDMEKLVVVLFGKD